MNGELGTHRWFFRRRLWRDVAASAPHLKGRLLDLGCGIKPYEPLFASRVTKHIGFDLPQSLDSRGCRADATGSASALPFADGSFDSVLCTQMLDDFPEPSVIVSEIARVLAPGGCVLLTVNQLYPVHDPPCDFYRFTRYGLEYQMKKAGLEPVEFRATGGQWMSAGILILLRMWAIHARIPLISRLKLIPMIGGYFTGLFFDVLDRLDPSWAGAPNLLIVARKP
jgi:SAM-dependent methyltransferase